MKIAKRNLQLSATAHTECVWPEFFIFTFAIVLFHRDPSDCWDSLSNIDLKKIKHLVLYKQNGIEMKRNSQLLLLWHDPFHQVFHGAVMSIIFAARCFNKSDTHKTLNGAIVSAFCYSISPNFKNVWSKIFPEEKYPINVTLWALATVILEYHEFPY